MKYIISTIKFITILGLGAILLLGCVREQPKPVVKETQPSDPNYYIGPGGYAIDLREVENDDKRALGRWDALRKPLAKMVCDMKELSDIEDYRRLVLETYRNEINKVINIVNERYEREYGRL